MTQMVAALISFFFLVSVIAAVDVTPTEFNERTESSLPISCDENLLQVKTPPVNPQFTKQFVYPVEVCVSIDQNIAQCQTSSLTSSFLSLANSIFGTSNVNEAAVEDEKLASLHLNLSIQHKEDKAIILESSVSDVKNQKLFCHVFDVCSILESFNGKKDISMGDVKLMGIAEFKNYGSASKDPVLAFSVLRGTGIHVESKANRELVAHDLINHPYSVACDDSIDCVVSTTKSGFTGVPQKLVYSDSSSYPTCSTASDNDDVKSLVITTFTRGEVITPPPTTATPSTSTEASSPSTATEATSPSTATEATSPSTATEATSPSTATEAGVGGLRFGRMDLPSVCPIEGRECVTDITITITNAPQSTEQPTEQPTEQGGKDTDSNASSMYLTSMVATVMIAALLL